MTEFDDERCGIRRNLENMGSLSNVSMNNDISSHRKIIGPVIIGIKKFMRKIIFVLLRWYIEPILKQQSEFNSLTIETINDLNKKLENVEELIKLYEQNNEEAHKRIEQNNEEAHKRIEQNNEEAHKRIEQNNEEAHKRIEQNNEEAHKRLESNIESVNVQNGKRYNEISECIKRVALQNDESHICLSNNIESVNIQSQNRANEINEKLKYVYKKLNVKCDVKYLNRELDYFAFEDRFRGAREDISEKQRQYARYFKNDLDGKVLDIGCGRGEFLEIMKEENISAYGVDVYEPFINFCLERNLEAQKSDALTHLNSLEDESLNGIFMDSVIEHIEDDYILALFNMAYRKLKKGCYFIITTPNPEAFGGMNCFNIDLEHKKPIHYLTVEYLLKVEGFSEVTRHRSIEAEFPVKIAKIEGLEFKNVQEFNSGIDEINEYLFGNKEYVVIAKK